MTPEAQSKLDFVQARIQSIPEKWRLCKVVDVLNIRNNMRKPISQDERHTIQGTYPYYGPTKIQDWISTFEQDGTYALIGEDGDHFLKFHKMPQTQIVTGKCTVNNHAHIIESGTSCDSEWFYFYFRNRNIINFLSRQGAGRFKLNKATLEKLPLLVPPLPEQRKIAKILQTWDRAIATTEKLIDASKQQKKALMQQLLTGKKRFAGFEGEWETKNLSDISQVIVSPVDKKTIAGEIPIELCNYTDVYYKNYITRDIPFMRATATPSEILKYTIKQGDVLITKDSETPGDIAVPSLVSEKVDGIVCGYHLAIIRPDSSIADSGFLSHLFSMQVTRYYFFRLATGATRFGLSVGAIKKAEFSLPDTQEQIRISATLTLADKKIENLTRKATHLKHEKKALMQQLLTGKRRVKAGE